MSYLEHPRLVFAGRFQADVATGNNAAGFYDLPPGVEPPPGPANWNILGSGAFRLLDCVVPPAGEDSGTDPQDPIHGARVTGADDRVSAKIVDLDPQWQFASELWGLRIRIVGAGGVLLAGDFEPAGFRDLRNVDGSGMQARYQSVLGNLDWAPPGTSAFVDRLRAATGAGLVSIRLVTREYDFGSKLGTLLGAIGPYRSGEPRRFVAGRRFRSTAAGTNHFDGWVSAAGDRFTADLSNALPPVGAGADATGELQFAVLTRTDIGAGEPVVLGPDAIALGEPLPDRGGRRFADAGGLVDVEVPGPARALIADHPLALLALGSPARVLVRESRDGWLVRADAETCRVEAGEPVAAPVHVTRYGAPVAGVQLQAALGPLRAADGEPALGAPADAVTVHQPDPTGADGRTTLRFDCADPGTPRGFLDGQLYGVFFGGGPTGQSDVLITLVFDHHEVPEHPTWERDVRPLLAPYATLYPAMTRRVLDLADYDAVRRHRAILQLVLSRELTDPNFMPVTRDLSRAKRTTILTWLALPDLPRGEAEPGDAAPPAGRRTPDAVDATGIPADAPFIGKARTARDYEELLRQREDHR